jgi:ZIP family zinc transporter
MAVLLALTTLLSTAAGGLVALRARDRMHLILGLAGGVMLGLIAFDLLPEVFRLSGASLGGIPLAMVAFAAGFLGLHVVERAIALHSAHEDEYGEHGQGHRHPHVGLASAIALAVHSFLDGVGIGLAFQVNAAVGVAVAIAVIAHDFADGLNTVSIMLAHRNSRRRAVAMLVVDAVAPVVGAASTLLFTVSDQVLGVYLGFFAGFLLYLATGDILPEAHSGHPSRLTLLSTVGGVLFMLGVVVLAGEGA